VSLLLFPSIVFILSRLPELSQSFFKIASHTLKHSPTPHTHIILFTFICKVLFTIDIVSKQVYLLSEVTMSKLFISEKYRNHIVC